jgi:LuxR family maltose regulon positive regulatory protein
VQGLHRRASDWHAAAGEPVPAVKHALAAGDVDRAADLVESAVPALGRQRAEATLRAWLDDFPDDVVGRRPVLALGLVGGLMQLNEFAAAEALLAQVERWLPAIRTRLA